MNKPHLRYKNQTPRERTWTIHFIALEKAVKGFLLLAVAFRMLTLINRDVHAWAEDFISRHGIDLANRYVQSGLERLAGVGNKQLVTFGIIAIIYAALLFTEGIGLWLQKRWAEYLTAFATALFIPFELYELYERFTWVRIAILILNIFVVWYLATRLRDEKTEDFTTENTESTEKERTRVKICGITNLEDAQQAVESGADQLGFNFYEKSPRYISPQNARAIIDKLPSNVFKVGIFVNESVDSILEIAKIAGLDAIQLHGDEDFGFVSKIRRQTDFKVIKALRITSESVVGDAMDLGSDAILLDGYSHSQRGGTGKTFDWSVAKDVVLLMPRMQIYLAGGLNPGNVAEAIHIVKPYAVDVASGVESSPGKKNPEKVAAFIKAAKEAI